jgi:hypothetical protein
MFKLQDRMALISVVSIKNSYSYREDDIRSWGNFLIYFSHNAIPT